MSTPAPVEPAREFDLVPPDNARLANLCGPLDENLRLIEDRLGVSVKRRGSTFRIAGARAHAAEDVVRDLFAATTSEDVSLDRVHLALRDSPDLPGALTDEPRDPAASTGGRVYLSGFDRLGALRGRCGLRGGA